MESLLFVGDVILVSLTECVGNGIKSIEIGAKEMYNSQICGNKLAHF